MTPATLRPAFVAELTGGGARGEGEEEVPQFVAVGQVGEPALFRAALKGEEGGQGGVFLIRDAAQSRRQSLPGRRDHAREEPLPQLTGGDRIAGLDLLD